MTDMTKCSAHDKTGEENLFRATLYVRLTLAAARLAQLGEHRSAERKAVGSNPGRTNTQGF